MIRYISAQPATWYFHWQLDVLLHNFTSNDIPLDSVHCLLLNVPSYDRSLWNKLRDKYPQVTFALYEDTRTEIGYVPSLRPHILHKHFERNPSLYEGPIFYHDSDIAFTRPFDVNSLLTDTIWYLSDARGYVGANYIKSKGYNILQEMCEIINIPVQLVEDNQEHSGGAQYLMKDIPRDFWFEVEREVNKLHNYFIRKSVEYAHDIAYHPIQTWTADMWVVLWNAWKHGKTTRITNDLDFCWPLEDITRWSEAPIFHNAGVVGNTTERAFYKGNHTQHAPVGLSLDNFDSSLCSYNYVKQIIECLR